MKTGRILLFGCVLVLGCVLAAPAFALQTEQVCARIQYFPETGHNVCDDFLEFFGARGGAEILGYPLTEAFREDGQLVQYFQRVQLTHHPQQTPGSRVQMAPLGRLLAPQERTAPIPRSDRPKSNDPQSRYFAETGHTVQYGFLAYFDEMGGVPVFGYPVTEFFAENGRMVQYFEYALMQWDPNRRTVVLHNLGEMWVDQHRDLRSLTGPAPQLAPPGAAPAPPATITGLRVTASVRSAFWDRQELQTVWVYVNDQSGRPVEGAEVSLDRLLGPAGRALTLVPTDAMGHTQTDLTLNDIAPGQLVILQATVRYQSLTAQARTFFLAWW